MSRTFDQYVAHQIMIEFPALRFFRPMIEAEVCDAIRLVHYQGGMSPAEILGLFGASEWVRWQLALFAYLELSGRNGNAFVERPPAVSQRRPARP